MNEYMKEGYDSVLQMNWDQMFYIVTIVPFEVTEFNSYEEST